MYVATPSYGEILQGDVYRLTIASTRFEANRVESAFRLGAHVFAGEIEEQLFAVLSHDCDITDDKVDDQGRPINPDKFPVVLGKISEIEPRIARSITEKGGFEAINDPKAPTFFDMFYYPDLPGEAGTKHAVNFSDVITVRRKSIRSKTKLAELDDESRFAMRVKLILHFGRGNDKNHPLGAFAKHLAESMVDAGPKVAPPAISGEQSPSVKPAPLRPPPES